MIIGEQTEKKIGQGEPDLRAYHLKGIYRARIRADLRLKSHHICVAETDHDEMPLRRCQGVDRHSPQARPGVLRPSLADDVRGGDAHIRLRQAPPRAKVPGCLCPTHPTPMTSTPTHRRKNSGELRLYLLSIPKQQGGEVWETS